MKRQQQTGSNVTFVRLGTVTSVFTSPGIFDVTRPLCMQPSSRLLPLGELSAKGREAPTAADLVLGPDPTALTLGITRKRQS